MGKNNNHNFKITAVYSFDNSNQLKQFLISVKSLYAIDENVKDVKLILFLTEDIKKKFAKDITALISEINSDISFVIRKIDFNTGVTNSVGKFAWIYSPFMTDTEYIIQLDNDTIINISIWDLIKKYKTKIDNSLFLGRTDENILKNPLWGEPVKFILKIDDPYSHGNYINTGVVLFKRDNAIKEFVSKENLFNKINKLHKKLIKNNFIINESDQNILYIMWGNKFNSSLPRIYNYPPKVVLSDKEHQRFLEGNIIHHNIWFFNNLYRINKKVDIDEWLSKSESDSYKYLVNFYLFQTNRYSARLLSKNEQNNLDKLSDNLNNTLGMYRKYYQQIDLLIKQKSKR